MIGLVGLRRFFVGDRRLDFLLGVADGDGAGRIVGAGCGGRGVGVMSIFGWVSIPAAMRSSVISAVVTVAVVLVQRTRAVQRGSCRP